MNRSNGKQRGQTFEPIGGVVIESDVGMVTVSVVSFVRPLKRFCHPGLLVSPPGGCGIFLGFSYDFLRIFCHTGNWQKYKNDSISEFRRS